MDEISQVSKVDSNNYKKQQSTYTLQEQLNFLDQVKKDFSSHEPIEPVEKIEFSKSSCWF